jgi:hypothetical protein
MASSPHRKEHPKEWNVWLELPRPRIVRTRQGSKFWLTLLTTVLIVVPLLLLGILFMEWASHPVQETFRAHAWSAAPFIFGPLLVLLVSSLILARDRRLIRYGEISIANIVAVRPRRGGRTVTYVFRTRTGASITASCRDNTRSYVEGMAMPVFFNPAKPAQDQVALCGTPYEPASL